MQEQVERRMVIDAKKAWSNLPYALMPASVGLFLVAFPWFGSVEPGMTAPIMIPFGLVWLVLGGCINHYHSELILDHDSNEVIYHSSLVLHSWDNRVAKGNVKRVLLTQQDSKYRFLMEVIKGEDLSVTTFDYWRSREWSELVAHFLQVPLVDECRDGHEVSPEDLLHSIGDEPNVEEFDPNPPGKIEATWRGDSLANIFIPNRRLLRSSRLPMALGALSLVGGIIGLFLLPIPIWLTALLTPILVFICWARPISQMSHHEELEISPNGVLLTITTFGRSKRVSFPVSKIRQVSVVTSEDPRFENHEFNRHAVCIEGLDAHVQVGANLPKLEHVQWLRQALIHVLTKSERSSSLKSPQ